MRLMILITMLLATGCTTTAYHLSDAKEGWFDVKGYKGNSIYYCTNKKIADSPKIDPICYEADVLDRKEK